MITGVPGSRVSTVCQVIVFGGNGFVGQRVCQAALRLGAEVVCVNRSGAPSAKGKDWISDVRWVRGDIFKPDDYSAEVCFDIKLLRFMSKYD